MSLYTVQTLLSRIRSELEGIYDPGEINAMIRICTLEILGITQTGLPASLNKKIEGPALDRCLRVLSGLKKEEPLQYLLGYTWFCGMKLLVNKNVLIPRPETEELVDLICRELNPDAPLRILDIGSGSGCIAIALKKKFPASAVKGVDVSAEALQVAVENAAQNNTEIEFMKVDILNPRPEFLTEKYDVIVSNPPYVSQSEKKSISKNVIKHEPHLALFVENNEPLLFFNEITAFAHTHLKANGRIYFEINEKFGQKIFALLENTGFKEVRIIKDINNKDRFATACV